LWTGAYTRGVLAGSLLGGGLLGGAVCFLFGWLEGYTGRKRVGKSLEETVKCNAEEVVPEAAERDKTGKSMWRRLSGVSGWKLFLGSLMLILLAWLPAYLAYYPAICAYDMPIQTGQILEGRYVDHHPIAHTLLIKFFMDLGAGLGSITAGIGLLCFLQLVFLGSSFAYGTTLLQKAGVKWWIRLVVQLFCMFYPFHWYIGVSITKDTVFTAFFVFQILSLYELLEQQRVKGRLPKKELLFAVSTIGMMLFRNNGKYAMLVLLGILMLAFLFGKSRRFLGKILLWTMGAFLAGNLLLSGIFRLSHAEQGDRREMLSMPIQQLARTMLYHGGVGELAEDDGTMWAEARALINDFILNEGYRQYNPAISDPVKANTNTYVVRYRARDFASTYVKLLGRYAGDFVNAGLAVNAGYLYPGDTTHAYINVTGDDRVGRGYVQTYWVEGEMNEKGIYKASLWKWLHGKLERWADENAYLKLPVLKYLFVPGVWLWVYLLLLAELVRKQRYRRCIPLALVGGYFVTLLLGPTVQLRYIYPLMVAFPFVLVWSCGAKVQSGVRTAEPATGEAARGSTAAGEGSERSGECCYAEP